MAFSSLDFTPIDIFILFSVPQNEKGSEILLKNYTKIYAQIAQCFKLSTASVMYLRRIQI